MTGVITLRDVLAHPFVVVRGFGCRVFVRCIWAACRREQRTFLSVMWTERALGSGRVLSNREEP